MSFEAAASRRIIAICLTGIAALSGMTLKVVYFDHSTAIAKLSTRMEDVANAIDTHDRNADASLHELAQDEGKHETRLSLAEQRLAALENKPPVVEHDYTPVDPSQRFTPIPPNPFRALGNDLSHIINPPHHWRRRP